MLSGSGRHRRPRQIPALVVAAGVTGAGLAMPLMAASGAQAADAATWDRVAQCESGGLWSADSDNGFYGGLQLTRSMWEQHGGTEFAPRPDLASRAQQIAVAERILEDRGPYAWPSCALDSGLVKDGPTPKVDPGGDADSADTPRTAPHHKAPDASPATPDKSAPGPSESGKPGTPQGSDSSVPAQKPDQRPPVKDGDQPTGKHRKPTSGPSADPSVPPARKPSADPAPSPSSSSADPGANSGDRTSGQDAQPGAEASAGIGNHRADSPGSGADRASRGGAEARTEPPSANDYTVRPGDNLSVIAEQHSVQGGWHRLYRDNQKTVGSDPDLILPGQQLELKK
ncbi:transglycosylase family protein [Streptomyces sp. NPDC052396]|uniref:transglycosylase family protein n=1 Tax=Streptomyces sp. NPDC052396 TaxID=3365689 RepID=UPI0037D2211C